MKNEEGYYEALEIIDNAEQYTKEEVENALTIKEECEYELQKERESHYVQPHYPDAPEGSIYDY